MAAGCLASEPFGSADVLHLCGESRSSLVALCVAWWCPNAPCTQVRVIMLYCRSNVAPVWASHRDQGIRLDVVGGRKSVVGDWLTGRLS